MSTRLDKVPTGSETQSQPKGLFDIEYKKEIIQNICERSSEIYIQVPDYEIKKHVKVATEWACEAMWGTLRLAAERLTPKQESPSSGAQQVDVYNELSEKLALAMEKIGIRPECCYDFDDLCKRLVTETELNKELEAERLTLTTEPVSTKWAEGDGNSQANQEFIEAYKANSQKQTDSETTKDAVSHWAHRAALHRAEADKHLVRIAELEKELGIMDDNFVRVQEKCGHAELERDQLQAALADLIESYDLAMEHMPEIGRNMLIGFFLNIKEARQALAEMQTKGEK